MPQKTFDPLCEISHFNDTEMDFPWEKTIYQLFEEQVERTPENTAAIFMGRTLDYRRLNEKANSLARFLRNKNVGPDSLVGILMERSLEMIIGIFGILKAGGAYLPISPSNPGKRIDHILLESGTRILLTQGKLISKFDNVDTQAEIVNIDIDGNPREKEIYGLPTGNLPFINSPFDLAYVIYTSGSTGKPKGVGIEHYSLINRLNWMQRKYPINSNDTILQKTPYFFDVSVWEMFWWSMVGARVCFMVPGGEKFPQFIIETCQKNSVTVMHFVPSMMSVFLDYLRNSANDISRMASLKQVFASGEKLTSTHVQSFHDILYQPNGTRLANLYGPTEATVDVTYFDCLPAENPADGFEKIPIGKPIDNTQLYILDEDFQVKGIGETGELFIGGVGVARGYINRPELTQEKFVSVSVVSVSEMPPASNLFEKDTAYPRLDQKLLVRGNEDNYVIPNESRQLLTHTLSLTLSPATLYRTGDLARWFPDGNVEFLGRGDFQVKIHGLRIELEEIEAVISRHPAVLDNVVVVKQYSKNITMIVGYVVFKAGQALTIQDLKAYLKDLLPEYMVPNLFIFLDQFPLTPTGKVDRNSLPEPTFGT